MSKNRITHNGVPEDKALTAQIEKEKLITKQRQAQKQPSSPLFSVAVLTVYTTDGEQHTLELEYRKSTSSPLNLAEGVNRNGFNQALDTRTVCYGPGAILKVIVERADPDPGR